MSLVIDVDSQLLATAAALVVAGMVVSSLYIVDAGGPAIRQGQFVADTDEGLFAVGARSCSTDSDCAPTTCAGTEYLTDTDGDVACTDHDGDGDTECTGYDESYADAAYCGGRYDYNCDSSGCKGYKAACEDDCSANTGCDTYSFCSSDTNTDDGDSDSDESTGGQTGSTSTPSCTDQCQHLAKRCAGATVEQCQDTDSDACTDGYVAVTSCQSCTNGACTATATETDIGDAQPETDLAEEVTPGESQTLFDRIREVYQRVLVALLGGL